MLDVTTVEPGTRLRLAGEVMAEVEENLGNGEWLRVRLLDPAGAPAPTELCHATDIVEIVAP